MEEFNRKKHWETIYQTKAIHEVSWYQPQPEISLELILATNPSKTAKIIDIGGGDSFLVDHLLDLGFQNITVLDISKSAIERAQARLGDKADAVTWIEADVSNYELAENYDIWHDRAAFHFLREEAEINRYIHSAATSIVPKGRLIIGTFSEKGPVKCSGIDIQQYSEDSLVKRFGPTFLKEASTYIDHPTPFNTLQNFIFCRLVKSSPL